MQAMRDPFRFRYVSIVAVLVLLACGGGGTNESDSGESEEQELGPYGPPLGVSADVVYSLTVKLSGDMNALYEGKKGDGTTGVRGLCNPETFANFGFDFPAEGYHSADATIMSKGEIGTGATGEFRLDWLWISLMDENLNNYSFKGPATMTITRHDASPGNRRMTGTIRAEGLPGSDQAEGKTIDAQVDFDMEYSCGVK